MTDHPEIQRYLNPLLTVAQAAPVLEQLLRQRTGSPEYERLERTITLQAQELTTDEVTQVEGIFTLAATSNDHTNSFLAILWLAHKQSSDPTAQAILLSVRHMTLLDLRLLGIQHKAQQ